ncbi:MAG: DVU_1553 family AMP-dependent CoA ligase [Christensenellales bacterium]|jgi:phenylacetate-CoA ligase
MKKTNLEPWICEVEGISTLNRQELEDLQLRRLNELLLREKARGGFYSGLPERLHSLKELETLPFTTPEQLAARGAGMLLVSQSKVKRIITESTSGTTGAAKRVFYTERDCENTVGFFAAGLSELVFPGDGVMIAMPFSGPFGLGELIAAAIERLGGRPIKTGIGKTFGELERALDEEQPAAFVGMPVPLLSVLRYCGKKSLLRALVSGDACPKSVVKEVECILGTRIFPHYGSREMGLGGAVTCPAHEGMHLRENHVIAEIIGKDGSVLPDGEEGELCLTTIGMEAMPLIRYKTGDTARILKEPCPCGGVTKRLDGIERIFADAISPLDDALFTLPHLIDYRAERQQRRLFIFALTDGTSCEGEIRALAGRVIPQLEIVVTERPCTASDGLCYLGKRQIVRAI